MFDEWLSVRWKESPTPTLQSTFASEEETFPPSAQTIHEFFEQGNKKFKLGWKDIFQVKLKELDFAICKVMLPLIHAKNHILFKPYDQWMDCCPIKG
jgi:hypothetical protein